MKRDDLKALGLPDEQINSVMALHGQTVNPLNTKISELEASEKNLQEQVAKRDEDLEKIQKDATTSEDLKQQIKDLQEENETAKTEWEKQLLEVQRNAALDTVLAGSKVKNAKALTALLDQEKITFKDGELTGLNEQIDALKESDPYLFDLGKRTEGYEPNGGSAASHKNFDEALKAGEAERFFQARAQAKEGEK